MGVPCVDLRHRFGAAITAPQLTEESEAVLGSAVVQQAPSLSGLPEPESPEGIGGEGTNGAFN